MCHQFVQKMLHEVERLEVKPVNHHKSDIKTITPPPNITYTRYSIHVKISGNLVYE